MVETFSDEMNLPAGFGMAVFSGFDEGLMKLRRTHFDYQACEDPGAVGLFSVGVVPNELLHLFDLTVRHGEVSEEAEGVVLDANGRWILGFISEKSHQGIKGSSFAGKEVLVKIFGENGHERSHPIEGRISHSCEKDHVFEPGKSFPCLRDFFRSLLADSF